MAELSSFWDRMAERYAAQPIADEAAYQTKLAETRRRLRPDMDLFEFGCGTGSTALVHAPYVRHIRAVDFSEAMLDIARGKASDQGIANVSFERGDITTMPIAPASYDMVLGLSILHLIRDKQAVISKVYDILRPGGYFVSSTTCIGDVMKVLGLVAPLGRALGLLPMLNVMTHDQLVAAVQGPGFTIEHNWRPHPKAATFLIARKPETA